MPRNKNTKPEILVREALNSCGYEGKYRLHATALPGTPDIIIPKKRIAIFVNGCFWHQHKRAFCPLKREAPKKNSIYWREVFNKTLTRDKLVQEQITEHGWKPIVIWECDTLNQSLLGGLVKHILN